ncbi:MAG: hypothetical protein R3B65_01980 [Candidatus Paceibacterota bacterium]
MENLISDKDKNNFEPKIEFAKESDIEGIISVQESVLLSNKDLDQDPGKSGFLATKINRDIIEKAIVENGKESVLIIAKDDKGSVVAYLLAYDINKWIKSNPEWLSKTDISSNFLSDKKIIYGKHVASNRTIAGIGRKLEKTFMSFAKDNGYDMLLVEICEGPQVNKKSIDIQIDEFNMKKISQYKDGEYTFGVYIKNL